MNRNLQWKLLGIILIMAAAIWLIWPPFSIKDNSGNILQKGKINLGLDLQGGMHLVLKVDTSKLSAKEAEGAPERALEIIKNRIDQFGVGETVVQRQGRDSIIVQLPGITDRQRALELIGHTALLEFRLVSSDPEKLKQAIDGNIPEGYELKDSEDNEKLLVEKKVDVTGADLVNATVKFDQSAFNQPMVAFVLNKEGGRKFSQITGDNVGKRLAIVLDGVVKSAPNIKERIPGGEGVIQGRFTPEQASDLAIVLRAGALPAPVVIEEERTVGPLLGADSIKSGLHATLIGALLVFIFMAVYYRLAGLIANISLILNLVLILACLSMFRGTLTLPGIAGLILTLGMSVDANVLIYERIKEELRLGKSLKASIAAGYHKAFSAILDSNITTIIAAALIFQFGTGPIRGFAITLTIGLLANLFTAVTCTKVMFETLCENFGLSKLRMMNIFPQTNIDFIGKRKICYIISLVVVISGLVVFGMRGSKNYGVDFSGGTLQQYLFEKPVNVDEIRTMLKEIGYGNASIQQYGNSKEVMIRTQDDISKKLDTIFGEKFKDNKYDLLRIETVGPAVGAHLKKNAVISLLLGLLGILVYVMLRFNAKYAVAGVIALFHDVFIAVGALALTGRQFDLTVVAAILTIAGYSINDTIVIYDRIRENLRLVRKSSFIEIINLSVNQTLGRTMLTTGVTMLVVIALLFFGGAVLNDFSFCLFIGFVSGVYSTVYIASPLVISWQKHRQEQKR